MQTPLIHIGYMKTGSTWLQDYLFADGGPFNIIMPESDVRQLFIKPSMFAFDEQSASTTLDAALEANAGTGKVPVISVERLSGSTVSGGHDAKEIAARIKSSVGQAKILIVIREQQAMILSAYKQYVRECGTTRLKQFLNMAPKGGAKVPMFSLDFFEYDHLVGHYQSLFGKDNVLVLPFECLRDAPDEFVSAITDFCAVDASLNLPSEKSNVAMSNTAVWLRARTNLFSCRDMNNPGAWFHSKLLIKAMHLLASLMPSALDKRLGKRFKRDINDRVGSNYAASNKRLKQLVDIDLERWGYDLGE